MRPWRRIPRHIIDSVEDVERLCGESEEPLVLIFDVDNTISPQGVPPEQFQQNVKSAIRRFESLPCVARVIMLTNGDPRGSDLVISGGNKPMTTRRRLGLGGCRSPVWVVGDQVVTDGILAWRIGDRFLHLAIAETGEHPRQAAMRRAGRIVQKMFFRDG